MPWLAFLAGRHDHGYVDPKSVQEVFGLMYPTPLRSPEQRPDLSTVKSASDLPKGLLRRRIAFERGCDELETTFFARVEGLKRGECRMYRVEQHIGGRLIGGYTAILRKQS